MTRQHIGNLIFRSHNALILLSIPMAIVLPPIFVILFAVLQHAHTHFYGGCLPTKQGRFLGTLAEGKNHIQTMAKRYFNRDISWRQSEQVERTIRAVVIVIVAAKLGLQYVV